ncbi:hypothetical protein A1F94_005164 [Pyrenophora tritici-repentis]|nr:hypothetical protein A1F94_005164 [Pyrenophora tritici-repentis]
MPVAKEQVGDVPEGLVPAIKLEPPPGFEQDEWEQLTDDLRVKLTRLTVS